MSLPAVQDWFRNASKRKKREIAKIVREAAEELAGFERDAAPQGPTGNTKQSVRVTRTRNELKFIVRAGGTLTTKKIGTRTYERPIKIGKGDTSGVDYKQGGANVEYDYALGNEFGNSRTPAKPWFYPTGRAKQAEIESKMMDKIEAVMLYYD